MARGIDMNKILVPSLFLTFLLVASISYSQDATEPADSTEAQPAEADPVPVPVIAPVVSPTISVPGENPTTKILREGIPLRVRQEQAFDVNGNNRLDPDEIRAFFKSIYEDTANGEVKNTSDVLFPFDKDKDGFISRSEASAFPR